MFFELIPVFTASFALIVLMYVLATMRPPVHNTPQAPTFPGLSSAQRVDTALRVLSLTEYELDLRGAGKQLHKRASIEEETIKTANMALRLEMTLMRIDEEDEELIRLSVADAGAAKPLDDCLTCKHAKKCDHEPFEYPCPQYRRKAIETVSK